MFPLRSVWLGVRGRGPSLGGRVYVPGHSGSHWTCPVVWPWKGYHWVSLCSLVDCGWYFLTWQGHCEWSDGWEVASMGPGTWSFQEMSSFSLLSGGSWVSMGPGTTRGLVQVLVLSLTSCVIPVNLSFLICEMEKTSIPTELLYFADSGTWEPLSRRTMKMGEDKKASAGEDAIDGKATGDINWLGPS